MDQTNTNERSTNKNIAKRKAEPIHAQRRNMAEKEKPQWEKRTEY